MGNYRFRLANMMPNAWFYKLKEMSRGSRGHSFPKSRNRSHTPRATTTTSSLKPTLQTQQSYLPNRTSYYCPSRERPLQLSNSPIHPKASDTSFPIDPPRKSTKCRRPLKTSAKLVISSVSSACTCRTAVGSVCKSDSLPQILPHHHVGNDDLQKPIVADFAEFNGVEPWPESCNCRAPSSSADIIMDMDTKSSFNFDTAPELDLPPILTKPTTKFATKGGFDGSKMSSEQESYTNGVSLNTHKSPSRRTQQGIHRIKIRTSSPRLVSKRVEANQRSKTATGSKVAMQQRKGIIESFAIVKSSSDPQRDFGESMMEMILENNIQSSKDLEELLACYLSLNSEEYHDVIVKVFKQIWCDLTNIRF